MRISQTRRRWTHDRPFVLLDRAPWGQCHTEDQTEAPGQAYCQQSDLELQLVVKGLNNAEESPTSLLTPN
jgi:hypothetical protein